MYPALSVVIPAYNEASRLPQFLEAARAWLTKTYGDDYEIVVVNDGSSDGLDDLIEVMRLSWPQLRLISHTKNEGKGAAVRTGVQAANGELILVTDADGATPIEEVRSLQAAIDLGADVAVGSRLVPSKNRIRKRAWRRHIVGTLFSSIVGRALCLRIRDTQCGFKLFRRAVARHLFEMSQDRGYLFDVEILCLAQRCGYRVLEVPVHWREIPGSKLRVIRDGWAMLRGLIELRRRFYASPRKLVVPSLQVRARTLPIQPNAPFCDAPRPGLSRAS
jgi:dolichyl-phosphate beta-glucosyltransferase